ncbi:MAG TPA: zinc ribbon domain-containing protein [Anaerolineaceae bacterium]|nr:zinc ribbon domain-containing protein [Anaerolineaceae bacterium]
MMNQSPYTSLTCPQCGASLPSFDETLFCAYCGAALIRTSPSDPTQDAVVQGIRLKRFICVDSQGTGMDAFHLLMPAGWQPQGGITWLQNSPASPARIYFRIFDPNGMHAFTIFPHLTLIWSNNPMLQVSFPQGSNYLGSEVQPPVNALQALTQLVLPRFRNVPGMTVLEGIHLPELPQQLRSMTPQGLNANAPQADGAKVTIRYAANGRQTDEVIYGVTEYNAQQMPAMFGVTMLVNWTVDYLFGFCAPAGSLEKNRVLFQTILNSLKINPDWFARIAQITQYLVQNQIQQINQIGQLSRYISQVNNQISDTITQGYHQRQQVMDRINQQFSQSVRGTTSYLDPHKGYEVELPSGYRYAWTNALGEYVLSDQAGFNPNINSNLSWTEMAPGS